MKLKVVFFLILLLPHPALALTQAEIMMFQESQAEARRRERENDRMMFGLIQQWSASQFGCSYASRYGNAQASQMFGTPVNCGRQGGARNIVRIEKLPVLWLPTTVTRKITKNPKPLKDLVLNQTIPPTQSKPAPAVALKKPILPALAPAAGPTPAPVAAQPVKQPARRKAYDPDDNPDEEAWQRAHGRR